MYSSKPIVVGSAHVPHLANAIDAFNNNTWLKEHSLKDGHILYHYTDIQGLKGILSGRSIFCGHASAFNDPLEIQYGKKFVADLIDERITGEGDESIRAFLIHLKICANDFLPDSKFRPGQGTHDPFIACFCSEGDVLSQWRAYGDSGGGYCIGFEFTDDTRFSINDEQTPTDIKPILRKVIYDPAKQKPIVSEFLDHITAAARKVLERPGNHTEVTLMSLEASNVLIDMILSFKHEAFSVEEEWRLVRTVLSGDQTRTIVFNDSSTTLKPFLPTQLFHRSENGAREFAVLHVGFGPSHDPIRTGAALRLFVQHVANLDHEIAIRPEKIIVRGPGYSLRA